MGVLPPPIANQQTIPWHSCYTSIRGTWKHYSKVSGMLWEVQISKMANSLATFPSLLPRIADDLWFTLEKRLDDDAALTKEEEQYTALVRLPILSLLTFFVYFSWMKNKTLIIVLATLQIIFTVSWWSLLCM